MRDAQNMQPAPVKRKEVWRNPDGSFAATPAPVQTATPKPKTKKGSDWVYIGLVGYFTLLAIGAADNTGKAVGAAAATILLSPLILMATFYKVKDYVTSKHTITINNYQ
jgi:hypothetical protein